jgi:pyridoxal phosphate enzyme (YggS family)
MNGSREDIVANLGAIRAEIAAACGRSGRDPSDVLIVGAAKTVPSEAIAWAADAGLKAVGENYVKELRHKHDLVAGVVWHFIGTLQSSTAHHVADLADVVQTVSGAHAARRLAGRAAQAGKVLDVLIEVDLVGDRTGVSPEQLPSFVGDVTGLEGLRLRGLMTLPPIPRAAEDSRAWFAQLRDLRDRVRDKRPEVLELSMGMSLDYAIAVEEGATIVRIGTALFGPRTPLERK